MKVLVADLVADTGLDRLHEAGYEVETARNVEGDALLEAVSDANGLTVRSGTQVTTEMLGAASDLVIVGRADIGVDNIDIDAATQHGVTIASVPEGNVRAATEHTVAMSFAAACSIPQAHARLKDGEWAKSGYLGNEVNGKILGIVGLGRVGQEVAKKFPSLGMGIAAYDPYIGEGHTGQLGAELVEFDACPSRTDFFTVHTPLTPEMEGLISTDELETMGSGYPVDCARGGVVDETTLAEAVGAGVIDGAAVDVFADEPVSPDNPLLPVDDVIITPHLDASTSTAQEDVAVSTADQIVAAFRDEPVINAFNAPSVGESAFPRIQPYTSLAETTGKITAQLLDGRPNEVEVTYTDNITAEDIELVTASALKGVSASLKWQVNTINVPQVTEGHGIKVVESKSRQSDDFQSLVTVTVRNGDEEMTVSGTLFADEGPRVVRINGYWLDTIPYDQMLVARNYDKSGAIGFIGAILGESGVNIVGMFDAHRAKAGNEALTAHNLDDDVPESVCERLLADARIIDVDLITLWNGQPESSEKWDRLPSAGRRRDALDHAPGGGPHRVGRVRFDSQAARPIVSRGWAAADLFSTPVLMLGQQPFVAVDYPLLVRFGAAESDVEPNVRTPKRLVLALGGVSAPRIGGGRWAATARLLMTARLLTAAQL